jgi:Raf kinase inhibitor-like YbhB/YbcL family protein
MSTIQDTLTLTVSSPAFAPGELIPATYTCEGKNISPPLTIKNIPSDAKSLALVIEDPDATSGLFVHWIVWNIQPKEIIPENSVPGIEGKNGYSRAKYFGPCPPSGTHRYFFRVFALDTILSIPAGSEYDRLKKAMQKHILAKGEVIGLYSKPGSKL